MENPDVLIAIHVLLIQSGWQELIAALIRAHHSCIVPDQVVSLLELAKVPQDFKADAHLFAALCCLMERAFDLDFLLVFCISSSL